MLDRADVLDFDITRKLRWVWVVIVPALLSGCATQTTGDTGGGEVVQFDYNPNPQIVESQPFGHCPKPCPE